MSTPIARYFATLGVAIDKKSVAAVDTTLKSLEKKLKNFGKVTNKNLKINFDLSKFVVDNKKMSKVLGDALDQVSMKTVFEISRFSVDHKNLQVSMQRAMRTVGAMQVGAKGVPQSQAAPKTATPSTRSQASYSRANYLHAGGSAGALARYGVASLPFVGGVYGLSRANTISQELQANDLALRAVSGDKAAGYQEYLNSLGNRLGMTTRDLQPGFTQYLASAQGTALEGSIQKDFTNFTQYGAVMGLDPEQMKGSLKAITQMVSKQQIYAEELKGQLAERMPAAVRLMADAMTGGDTKALIKMMEDGKLDPNQALPKFFEEMRKRSESMLPEYFKTTRFAEGSMNKAAEDRFKQFAKAGGDAGFARLFTSLATVMKEAAPAVDALAKGFNEISKYTSFAMLLPQSFKRAFEGRDSWVADALGAQNIQLIKDWYGGISDINTEIKTLLGTAVEGWRLYFQEFGDEWLALLTGIQGVLLYSLKAINAALAGEGGKASNYMAAAAASATGKSREEAEAIANGVTPPMGVGEVATGVKDVLSYTPVGYVADKYISGYEWLGEKTGVTSWAKLFGEKMDKGLSDGDRASIDYQRLSDGDRASIDYQREMAMSKEQFKASQTNQVNINSGAIVINANTSDPEALSEILMSKLKDQSNYLITGQYTEALVHFPEGG